MMLLLTSTVRAGTPCPQIALRNFAFTRGTSLLGGDRPLSDGLLAKVCVDACDGETRGLADYMQGVGFVVVSAKLKGVLEDSNASAEFMPVPVSYNGQALLGYFIARSLHVVRGIDLSASTVELDGVGVALCVDRLVLDEDAFAGAAFALVHELAQFAVRDDLARRIDAAGCVGCSFVDPSEFRL